MLDGITLCCNSRGSSLVAVVAMVIVEMGATGIGHIKTDGEGRLNTEGTACNYCASGWGI
jgi:hypothetical protein